MSNALHDYAKLFEKYAANNGGMGAIFAGEDCLSLANEMRMDADAIDVENAKLHEQLDVAEHNRTRNAREYARMCHENDKLRELIKFAYDCATSGVSCRDCDLVFGEGSCQLKSDLENMGIGVDG